MATRARLPVPTWALLGLPLLVALLGGSLNCYRKARDPYAAANPGLHAWDLPQALEHLRDQGLAFEVVSADGGDVVRHAAFLTTTKRDFVELNCLPRARERLDRWDGVLYCE